MSLRSRRLFMFSVICATIGSRAAETVGVKASEPALPAAKSAEVRVRLEGVIVATTNTIAAKPDDFEAHSRRGDAQFFLGRFPEAVADYDRLTALRPETDAAHWRRGIALFYAGQYAAAAAQFERYHSFDNVDRENGIWRYLSQVKAYGRERARAELLKYTADDREPVRGVYDLFAGKTTNAGILEAIAAAELAKTERAKRLFYANLYIGLNELIEDRPQSALPYLQAAVKNDWPQTLGGYGPEYMWHVARLQADLLAAAATPGATPPVGNPPVPAPKQK